MKLLLFLFFKIAFKRHFWLKLPRKRSLVSKMKGSETGFKEFYNFVYEYEHYVKVKLLVAQLYLTLCDPMDYKLPGLYPYSAHGILQTRILEWVAIPFSSGFSHPQSPLL